MLAASVIIPCYERTEELERAVRSALAQDFDSERYEVIVVDSSPRDHRNVDLVERLRPLARCGLRVFHKIPEGPGPSRNLGAHEAGADILAFLDSDCDADPGWLSGGVRAFTEGVGVVQGRTIPDPSVAPHPLNTGIDVRSETFVYEAANVFYARAAFERAGGFPPDNRPNSKRPLGGEDVDLAWAVKKLGWKSVFAPDALVVHPVIRMSLKQWIFPRGIAMFPRCARRHPEIRRFFFLRYFYDAAQACLALAMPGMILGAVCSRWYLMLVIPYLALRAGKSSKTLPGPLRLLRVFIYLPRDAGAFLIFLANSFRFRSLVL